MGEKQRQEIEESIKIETLQERINEINKQLNKSICTLELGRINKTNFHYEIKSVDKKNGFVYSSRYFIGKIETLEYISGIERGIQLLKSDFFTN